MGIGWTKDIRKRIEEHNSGMNFSTKLYIPWKLVFYAAFEEKKIARNFETYFKSGSGKAFTNKRLISKF